MVKRIELDCLEGSGDCFIDIDCHENGDFYIKMTGQDTTGKKVIAQGQVLSPFGGGGDAEKYRKFKALYDSL